MPVGSLDDDWFKSYAHICEKLVCIFCDLDRGPIFTKCVIYHAFNYMKQKNGHNFSMTFDTMMIGSKVMTNNVFFMLVLTLTLTFDVCQLYHWTRYGSYSTILADQPR